LLAAGSLLGIGLYTKRGRKHRRVDLYLADGSIVSLAGDSPEAARLLPLARDALRVVHQ